MSELKDLEKEAGRLDDRGREQKRAIEMAIDAACSTAKAEAVKRLAPQQAELAATRKALAEIGAKVDELRVAAALASKEGPAIGTRLFEWTLGGSHYTSRAWCKTSRTGVVKVWGRDSKSPANVRYSLPAVGDKYVRVLKKDDTESIYFDKLNDWKGSWHEEGWTPPVRPKGRF